MSAQAGDSAAGAGVKIATVWAAVGITTWSDVAAALAALYTFCLLIDLGWRRLGRPICERHGWVRRRNRRADDPRE